MSSQEIVPTVAVHQGTGLAVDGYVLLDITLHTLTGLRIELDETDIAEVSAIGCPQTTRRGV